MNFFEGATEFVIIDAGDSGCVFPPLYRFKGSGKRSEEVASLGRRLFCGSGVRGAR